MPGTTTTAPTDHPGLEVGGGGCRYARRACQAHDAFHAPRAATWQETNQELSAPETARGPAGESTASRRVQLPPGVLTARLTRHHRGRTRTHRRQRAALLGTEPASRTATPRRAGCFAPCAPGCARSAHTKTLGPAQKPAPEPTTAHRPASTDEPGIVHSSSTGGQPISPTHHEEAEVPSLPSSPGLKVPTARPGPQRAQRRSALRPGSTYGWHHLRAPRSARDPDLGLRILAHLAAGHPVQDRAENPCHEQRRDSRDDREETPADTPEQRAAQPIRQQLHAGRGRRRVVTRRGRAMRDTQGTDRLQVDPRALLTVLRTTRNRGGMYPFEPVPVPSH